MAEFNNRHLALQYIKERGYASHSSLKRYINGEAPSNFVGSEAQIFGKEVHSRWLEKKRLAKMSASFEMLCNAMIAALAANRIVASLMNGSLVEQEFKVKILGVMMLGYFDIINWTKKYVADLKTTKCTTLAAFVSSLDFLQAAIYLRATGFKDFFYIGITKSVSPKVIVFNAKDYPELLSKADEELVKWLGILKIDLAKKPKPEDVVKAIRKAKKLMK